MLGLTNLTQTVTNGSAQLMNGARQVVNSTTQRADQLSRNWVHNFRQNPLKQTAQSGGLVIGVVFTGVVYGYLAKWTMEIGENLTGYSAEEDPNLVYINDLAYRTTTNVVTTLFTCAFLNQSTVIFRAPPPPPAPMVPAIPAGPQPLSHGS